MLAQPVVFKLGLTHSHQSVTYITVTISEGFVDTFLLYGCTYVVIPYTKQHMPTMCAGEGVLISQFSRRGLTLPTTSHNPSHAPIGVLDIFATHTGRNIS